MQGRKDYQEKLYTNFQLSDRVPPDNFYRKLKETLDLRWLYNDTARYYGSEGQESIDPTVFFNSIAEKEIMDDADQFTEELKINHDDKDNE